MADIVEQEDWAVQLDFSSYVPDLERRYLDDAEQDWRFASLCLFDRSAVLWDSDPTEAERLDQQSLAMDFALYDVAMARYEAAQHHEQDEKPAVGASTAGMNDADSAATSTSLSMSIAEPGTTGVLNDTGAPARTYEDRFEPSRPRHGSSERDQAIILIGRARDALAKAHTIEDAKKIIDLAAMAEVYARRLGLAKEALQEAIEVRIRAERRMGELLGDMELSAGSRGQLSGKTSGGQPVLAVTRDDCQKIVPPTLSDLGVTKNESSRAQRLASLPLEAFDTELHRARSLGELSIKRIVSAALRASRKPAAKASMDDLEGLDFRIVYADPPWQYRDSGVINESDGYGRAERHYSTMSIEELCAMPVKDVVAKDAVLFMWVTAPLLRECFPIIDAWGFRYVTNLVWDKVGHNFGHYTSVRHEHLLICVRGSCTPDIKEKVPSVQSIKKSKVHSQKPEGFRAIIDKLYPVGKRVELFARIDDEAIETGKIVKKEFDGVVWHFLGNQVAQAPSCKKEERKA